MIEMATAALAEIPGGAGNWSAGGLVALIVILILTDRLVTRGRLLEERKEKELAQSNAAKQLEINAELAAAVKAHNETALLNKRVMEAVQEHHQIEGGEA